MSRFGSGLGEFEFFYGSGPFDLGKEIGHTCNGRYYFNRYVFEGYGTPSLPSTATRDGALACVTVGSQKLLVLYSDDYLYEYQWKQLR
jgi:hypothetical protein